MMIHDSPSAKRKYDLQKVERRAGMMATILEKVARDRLSFRSKKRLLIYVAKQLEEAETKALQGMVSAGAVAAANKVVSVSVSGLYKSQVYSAMVDCWIMENPHCVIKKFTVRGKPDAQLRVQCAGLSNECAKLTLALEEMRGRLIDLDTPGKSAVPSAIVSELNNAYFAIDALLEEFGEYLKFDSSGIVLDNVLQRKIIDMDILKGYLEWRKREVKPKA